MAEQENTEGQAAEELLAGNVVENKHLLDDEAVDIGNEVDDELANLDVETLISKIKQAQTKADENWDVVLRTKAEMENLRRRTEKDVSNAHKYGIEKMASELLPVKDTMEMGVLAAIELNTEEEAIDKIREGMELTLKMMNDAMTKIGIEEIAPEIGDDFDPEYHQAMTIQEVEGKKSNTIVAVMQKGYLLNARLLRPAMVMVAK
jgi:molecular chaperone GrpE